MGDNPYITLIVKCAAPGCGKTKGVTNHWWVMIPQLAISPDLCGPYLLPFSVDATRISPHALPLCGESCATKMLSKYMSEMKEGIDKCEADSKPSVQ